MRSSTPRSRSAAASASRSLHQEFDELSRAGLSPLRVLQMATWNAAEFLGATDMMGSVTAGKHADLVLLDANPLESVENLHRVSGVGPGRALSRPGGSRRAQGEGRRGPVGTVTFS